MSISTFQYQELLQRTNATKRIGLDNATSVAREEDLHDQIIQFCREQPQPWVCFHSRMDKRQHANLGMPDFVVATHDGRTIYAEAKRRGGKCTPAQNAMLHWLERNHQIAGVVTSLEEFKHLALTGLGAKGKPT